MPISDRQILAAKYISSLILAISISNLPVIADPFRHSPFQFRTVLAVNAMILVYISVVALFAICFRHQGAIFIPFYGAIALLLASDWAPVQRAAAFLRSILLTAWGLPLVSIGCALGCFEISLIVFRRKVLEF